MGFPFNIYLVVFVSALLSSLLTLPLWRRWCQHWGLVDKPGHRKIHDRPIALAGGFSVFSGLLIPVAAALLVLKLGLASKDTLTTIGANFQGVELGGWLSLALGRRVGQLTAILGGACGMLLIGWIDDKYELSPAIKFCGQLLIAWLVAHSGIRVTLFVPSVIFSYAITILWILTVTNAVNFMDNMNGLCAGLGMVATWCFAWGAAVQGQYLVGLIAFTSCGALIGFLPYNFPKASAFLGDAGSHLIGFLLAVLAILPSFYSRETPHVWAVLKPLLILAVPLGDLVCIVIIRWKKGQPFYVGDTNHLSHRLTRIGWSKTRAVLAIWLIAAVCGAISFL